MKKNLLILGLAVGLASSASAANVYWNANTQDWNSGAWTLNVVGGSATTWTNGDNAFFATGQGGTVRLNGTAVVANNVTFTNAKQLRFQSATLNSLTVNGVYTDLVSSTYTPNTNTGAKTFTFNSALANTINGTILNGSGTIGFTKGGNGAVTLSNTDHTYTGATTVTAGSLLVTGSIATSSGVTVSNGAILGGTGNGTTTGKVSAITLNGGSGTGGILSAGTGVTGDIGTLYGSSLAWNGATDSVFSQMKFDLGSSNASDKLELSGAMTKASGSIFDWDFGGTGVLGNTYTLVTAAGGFGTFDALTDFTYSNLASGLTGSFAISGSDLQFTTFSAVPEPTSALAGLLITAGLLRRRRRA